MLELFGAELSLEDSKFEDDSSFDELNSLEERDFDSATEIEDNSPLDGLDTGTVFEPD